MVSITEVTKGVRHEWYVGSAPSEAFAIKGALLQNPHRIVDVPAHTLDKRDGIWHDQISGMRFRVVKDTSGKPSEDWAYRVYELE